METKEKTRALIKRIVEGILIAVVSGVIVFTITTGQLPKMIDNTTDSENISSSDLEDGVPGKDTSDEDVPGKDTSDEDVPGKDTSDEDVPGKDTSNVDVPGKDTSNVDVPGKDTSNEDVPGKDTSDEDVPGKDTSNEDVPGKDTSNVDVPGKDTSNVDVPGKDTSDEDVPGKDTSNVDVPGKDTSNVDVSSKDALVKNIDELNGFVVNDWYYSCDGQTIVYQPDEPQYSVRVVFVGPDVCGWAAHLMLPAGSFSNVLSNNYEEFVDFTVTQGLYELQVFSDDGQMETVYHAILEITKSDTYEVFLNEPEVHALV